jgi:His-Xaa-Ser system protein HxsD
MQSRGEMPEFSPDAPAAVLAAEANFAVDLRCYPLRVVYRSCYAFTDRAYLWLEFKDVENILVSIARKTPDENVGALVGEFANALVDYALRDQIAAETATVRDALVQAALGGATKW